MNTTASLARSSLRCHAPGCNREILVGLPDVYGRIIGRCHATGRLAEDLALLNAPPDPEPPLPHLVAADPLSRESGAHPEAVRVIAAIRRKGWEAPLAEKHRYRQASPEVVAEVRGEELPETRRERPGLGGIDYADTPYELPSGVGAPIGSRRGKT